MKVNNLKRKEGKLNYSTEWENRKFALVTFGEKLGIQNSNSIGLEAISFAGESRRRWAFAFVLRYRIWKHENSI